MREKIFAGNWKMNKTLAETEAFLQEFVNYPGIGRGHQVLFFPPFTALVLMKELIGSVPIQWGSQNMHSKDSGAFTGEISPLMLAELGCSHVLIGHSERREIFGESDAMVAEKIAAAHKHGFKPMVCVGETLEERKGGQADVKVLRQVDSALADLTAEQAARQSFAYEPIWAIGTGLNASSGDAQTMCALIRKRVTEKVSEDVSAAMPILYGGSVKPGNIAEYLQQPDIDGALVGGASLKPDSFLEIIKNALGDLFGQVAN